MIKNDIKKLEDILKNSKKILIVSHARPDPDAISSCVFLHTLIKTNFPNKEVRACTDGALSRKLNYINEFDVAENRKAEELLNEFKPDTIFIIDAMNWDRISLENFLKVRTIVKELGSKVIIIDHHKEEQIDENDLYLNFQTASTTEALYEIFINQLKWKTYDNYANTAMTGIIADTGSFKYRATNIQRLFSISAQLIEDGADIEMISNTMARMTFPQMKILAEMAKNFVSGEEYNYTYISSQFFENVEGLDWPQVNHAYHYFMDQYIRIIGKPEWGFVVTYEFGRADADREDGIKCYKGSFRAVKGIDVTVFAKQLNGGGHKSAAGFAILAKNEQEAIDMVKKVIEEHKEEAYANK